MSTCVLEATEKEKEVCDRLRQAAVNEIKRRELDKHELAEILGVATKGAYLLPRRKDWPLALCFRVAEVLGLEVELTIKSGAKVAA